MAIEDSAAQGRRCGQIIQPREDASQVATQRGAPHIDPSCVRGRGSRDGQACADGPFWGYPKIRNSSRPLTLARFGTRTFV